MIDFQSLDSERTWAVPETFYRWDLVHSQGSTHEDLTCKRGILHGPSPRGRPLVPTFCSCPLFGPVCNV